MRRLSGIQLDEDHPPGTQIPLPPREESRTHKLSRKRLVGWAWCFQKEIDTAKRLSHWVDMAPIWPRQGNHGQVGTRPSLDLLSIQDMHRGIARPSANRRVGKEVVHYSVDKSSGSLILTDELPRQGYLKVRPRTTHRSLGHSWEVS